MTIGPALSVPSFQGLSLCWATAFGQLILIFGPMVQTTEFQEWRCPNRLNKIFQLSTLLKGMSSKVGLCYLNQQHD